MDTRWDLARLCLGLVYLCALCNGLPVNLENTAADSHTQLLTGLVAVLLTVCSVVFLAACLCCQRRNGFKEFRDSPVVASTASNLDHGHINPVANGEFTIFTPLSPPHQNNNIFLANEQIIARTEEDYTDGDVDVSSWFTSSEKDFPRIKLKYIREIGKGWFGRVVEGAAQDIEGPQKWTPVVVRILEATASSRERIVFLHDAAIYRCGAHSNILKLFGRCLDTVPLLLLQEYCADGDLKNYLRKNKSTSDKLLSSEYPLVWCCQLTAALKHLHDNKLTHPDLAARNCQLTANLTLKLGDYGLAVFDYPEDYYEGSPGVPVRWCAPESLSYTSTTLQPKKITPEANIWSLGVTMWEICECGMQPYASLNDDEVLSEVLGSPNVRLERPKCKVLYTDYVFRLMQLCWTESESRPGVSQISLMLSDLLQVYKNTASTEESVVSVGDFDRRWESFKPNNIVKMDNHIEIDVDDDEIATSKPLSPSLNNLHGSLDNLLEESQMESWLENVATKTGDMSYVRGLSDAIKDLDNALALENSTSSESSHQQSPAEFQLGPIPNRNQSSPTNQNDSLTDSLVFMQRVSSGSETEEENWKRKIERGAYSEKVRQKSRSVADLMVLTHIDQSESEPDTPLPSLDYRAPTFRNVRHALLDSASTYGSEGNLLAVQDTFQDELKKLQEERRDSLLFVPESKCSGSSDSDMPAKRLLQELNSPVEIQPPSQVFNVFNVTIDHQYSPVHVNALKLNDIIHFEESEAIAHQVPKLADIIRSKSELACHLTVDKCPSDGECYDSGVEGDKIESTESLRNAGVEVESLPNFQVPKLVDLIQDNDALMDYIIAKYETDMLEKSGGENYDSLEISSGDESKHDDFRIGEPVHVDFDLSASQEEATPNSLTHSVILTSTPFGKKSLPELSEANGFESLNLFADDLGTENDSDHLYSLETWDNFLGKAMDTQNETQDELFDSFTEPKSLLFVENEERPDGTYVCNTTFTKNTTVDLEDVDVQLKDLKNDTWESNGGWFLHPQSNNEEVSGELSVSSAAPVPQTSDTYVGFNMDDEIMAAIRNELLNKLPQAQGSSESGTEPEEEWETTERNEVFLKYNIYNTPLSPIPEESFEGDSQEGTPRIQSSDDEDDSDWSEQCEPDQSQPQPDPHHRHTPSQDSCCSNDTLFNLEELTYVLNDTGKEEAAEAEEIREGSLQDESTEQGDDSSETVKISVQEAPQADNYIEDFLANERDYVNVGLQFMHKQVAPLPSPEDKPWKQLPASLLSFDRVSAHDATYVNVPAVEEDPCPDGENRAEDCYECVTNIDDIYNEADYVNIVNLENTKNAAEFGLLNKTELIDSHPEYDNDEYEVQDELMGTNGDDDEDPFGVLTDIRFNGPGDNQLMTTSFSESNDLNDEQDWDSGSDTRSSSSGEFIWKEGEHEESLKALRAAPQDVLEDVKPMDGIQEESSSGSSSGSDEEGEGPEFVPSAWDKHAIPVKSALRSPEKTLEKPDKKKGVWFKKQKYYCVYEYPREPESPVMHSYDLWKPPHDYSNYADWDLDGTEPTLASDDFDIFSQNHHYQPKRLLNLYQLNNPSDELSSSDSTALDEDFFVSGSGRPFEVIGGLSSQFFPGGGVSWGDPNKVENATPDSGVEDVSTPAQGGQFVPGLEDLMSRLRGVPTLQKLASDSINNTKKMEDMKPSEVLGGLRHTRNRLKLDLPPSPSAFTSSRMFSIEPLLDPVVHREKPTFSTFGKSRFLVQHVDTPPEDDEANSKNVSFEAIPYKPMQKHILQESPNKNKVETVRGEASLLDSADEDSGIESSTLERKSASIV